MSGWDSSRPPTSAERKRDGRIGKAILTWLFLATAIVIVVAIVTKLLNH